RRDRSVTRLHHGFQRAALMTGIALHRLDEVGDEGVGVCCLDVDVGEGLIDPLAHGDEPVVDRDDPQHEHDDYADDDPGDGGGGHGKRLLGRRRFMAALNLWCGRGEGKRRTNGIAERAGAQIVAFERKAHAAGDEATMTLTVPAAADASSHAGAAIVTTDIPARLDRLRWGRFHTLVVVALGITWILDGLEVTLAGAISPALKESPQLQFSNADVGLASSAYLAGAVLGALFFGWL